MLPFVGLSKVVKTLAVSSAPDEWPSIARRRKCDLIAGWL